MTAELRTEPYAGHRCRCVITDGDQADRCGVRVTNPDQPVCDACEVKHWGTNGSILAAAGLHFRLSTTTTEERRP